MSEAESEVEFTSPSADSPGEKVLEGFKQSILLKLALLGVLQILIGAFVLEGVVAGMLGIFGAASVALGVLGYLAMWFERQAN